MGAISLILGRGQARTTIDALTLDAADSIDHESSATVTQNPIEDGSLVSDNVKLDNRKVTISGIVSEAPISILGSAFNVFTGAVASKATTELGGFARGAAATGIGSIGGLITNRNANDVKFPNKAYTYLQELLKARTPFTLVTSLEKYKNMICTRISVPQRKENGGSMLFTATFEQITVVQTKTILVPEKNLKNASGASKQNLGKQPVKEAAAQNTKGSTVLFDAFKKVGIL